MNPETKQRLDDQDAKLDAIFKSVEKTRKYFLVIIWVSVLAVILPVIGLIVAVPKFLDSYASFSGLL